MFDLNWNIGKFFEFVIEWMTANLGALFDVLNSVIKGVLSAFDFVLLYPHPFIIIIIFAAIGWYTAGKGVGIFTLIGLFITFAMGLWNETMQTLSLVITAGLLALVIAIPAGIWASKSRAVEKTVRPILDFMQTMPAFVYLIPAVSFFELGEVPGVVATLIFAMPPAVRLTNLGIRQVPVNVREAAISFGSTPSQMLFKVELPTALPTILAGVNQTIMLALSMVVIAGMIGAGGLGNVVLKGLTQMQLDIGFEGGLAIVILAIFLDRVTQALGSKA